MNDKQKTFQSDAELMKALLDGQELQSVYNNGFIKLDTNGNLIFIKKHWQYINRRDWLINNDLEDDEGGATENKD
jgi:hypothetical protein